LLNRAQIVGWNQSEKIFTDSNYDHTRDEADLTKILTDMLKDPVLKALVDRHIQHIGVKFNSGSDTKIRLETEYDASNSACEARWESLDTLCHETLHALVHPEFVAAAKRMNIGQVVREGFTEVLGAQLYNDHVVPKAGSDAKFKSELEAGVAGAPCPAPPEATIDYAPSGAMAEVIRTRVGDDNFRAAYFLGRTDLAGLP